MKYLGLNILPEEIEDAVRGCDILVTTTPVTQPIVKNEWISEGMHINAIGADSSGKEELEPEILKRAKLLLMTGSKLVIQVRLMYLYQRG
jgi:alanine dehydrogenase